MSQTLRDDLFDEMRKVLIRLYVYATMEDDRQRGKKVLVDAEILITKLVELK